MFCICVINFDQIWFDFDMLQRPIKAKYGHVRLVNMSCIFSSFLGSYLQSVSFHTSLLMKLFLMALLCALKHFKVKQKHQKKNVTWCQMGIPSWKLTIFECEISNLNCISLHVSRDFSNYTEFSLLWCVSKHALRYSVL